MILPLHSHPSSTGDGPDGEVKQAIETQLAMIASDPDVLSHRAELAMIYRPTPFQSAVATWNQVLSVDPERSQYWYMLARAQQQLGEYDAAIAAMKSAREASRREPLWWQPAFWHIEMGQAAEGIRPTIDCRRPRQCRRLRALACDDGTGQAFRGTCRPRTTPDQSAASLHSLPGGPDISKEGKLELAAPWLAQGDPRKPDFPDPWQTRLSDFERGIDASLSRIDNLLEQGRNNDASARVQEALLKWPEDVNLFHRQSEIYRRKGDIKRWLVILKRAEKLEPENAATHLNLSMAYNQNGDASLAMNHVIEAIKINPAMTAAHLQMGRLHILNDDIPEAATSLDKAFELGVEDPNERLQYAHVLMRARRPADAQGEAMLVTQVAPTNALGWCVLAESLYVQFKRDEAMKATRSGDPSETRRFS